MFDLIKNRLHNLKLIYQDVRAYLKLAASGHIVEHVTDFNKPGLKPVLLLHGFATTRKSVSILEKRLRDDGFDVFSINLGGFLHRLNTKGIDELALLVKNKLDSLSKKYGLGKITIIGHSKGGLIGRYYVSLLGGNKRVKTLITLSAPHNGSRIAILATMTVIGVISKSVWQMMPRSHFMKKLSAAPIPPDVKLVSIFSNGDSVVSPKQSRVAVPAGAKNIINVELEGVTHTDYLVKRGAYEEIRKYI